jgi:nickel/cobalt transporter (NicO) family protein
MRGRPREALLALLGALLACALLAPGAGAHPLGNFSTNQLTRVRIDEGQVRVAYVLDLAEIPTFQAIGRNDADGDGRIAGAAERRALIEEVFAEVRSGLNLTADGREVALGEPRSSSLGFPPGQSDLRLTRVELGFRAPLAAGVDRVELANGAYEGRIGWRAVQILPGSGTDVTSTAPRTDPTDGLRAYPQDLLASPASESEAGFDVKPGSGEVNAPASEFEPAAGSATTDGFAGALTGADTGGLLIIGLLAAAFGWGALHALSPGHGKAMVAGYLAGTGGRPRHALILGATVTVTHTAAVYAFGLITLAASEYVLPEQLYPWLGLVSGLLVVGIGFSVMRSRFVRWRAMRADAGGHDHPHSHHDHSHPAGLRSLIGLGVSGGLVPCPSALVVLIAAISQHRVGLGMVLILAFSLGLAATISAVGLAVIWGQRLVSRLRPERRLFGGRLTGAIPALSAGLIVLAGLLISYRALPALG